MIDFKNLGSAVGNLGDLVRTGSQEMMIEEMKTLIGGMGLGSLFFLFKGG